MDTARYLDVLEQSDSELGYLLKMLFVKFPLAVSELLKRAQAAGIESVDKLFKCRNKTKYASFLVDFFKEGRIKIDTQTIGRSNFETIKQKLELALQFIQGKIYSQHSKEFLFYGIPDEEFSQVRKFI